MKELSFALLFYLTATFAFAQKPSGAYLEVVRVMKVELNHTFDSTGIKLEKLKPAKATTKKKERGAIIDSAPIIYNPLVVLNDMPVQIAELNQYRTEDIKSIQVLQPNSQSAALYGSRGSSKGVVLLRMKERQDD